ncbi:hypothetical protein PFICI_13178 [Pestalotiopsis fici W106-1]|uniref:Inosine/uridine-preferring nucleoside hydrolase domain-containing protein n=1 Tax=Pestalotiopsis fici (strain W106-1 / CGMCC3.15140) TaxID=1229662 RepID=W3WLP6_PESFW|nr:uncharacterized protein PFICI_13178 [Pestalotiopsis fici W106-1]ETS74694.1 hypothetical protein PFICI_13178 [Pestalotiopsis fici W106-1]
MSRAGRTKVVVDTDIGTDPDDCLALAYLALHPDCDLLGVTIVTGGVEKRAAIAEVLLRVCGRSDVPIHLGRREPLLKGDGQPDVQSYEFVQPLDHRVEWPENTAVDFLRQTIRDNAGEVVLLTIGPLSNVGTLFALDPELPSLCRDIVSMAGTFFNPESHLEWNMLCDETATAIMLKTPRPRHWFVGLDVTRPCTLWTEDVEKRIYKDLGDLGALIQTIGDWWLKKKQRFTFHDPLAAAVIFQPDLCKWRRGRVVLDPNDGATGFDEGKGDDIVAYDVDPDAFFAHFFAVIKNADQAE